MACLTCHSFCAQHRASGINIFTFSTVVSNHVTNDDTYGSPHFIKKPKAKVLQNKENKVWSFLNAICIRRACTGFGWDWICYLYSDLHEAVLICAENRDVFITAEQGLHSTKASSGPPSTSSVRRLGVHKEFGQDTARTGDPSSPSGYSTPYGIVLSI